jgi:hypothetical protein
MNSAYSKYKIKVCIIGTGDWGAQVANVINLLGSRYELIGTINTSTSEDEKNDILTRSEMWYVAVPSEHQFEYVKNGLFLSKHIICESPVCNSAEERKEIYEILLKNSGNKKIFYCNFPYFLDQDFARLMSGGLLKKAKFFSIKCMGPKFKDDPEKSKKFYINQAFNLIFNTSVFMSIRSFDRFVVRDDFFGELHSKDATFLFEWGYSEYPKLDISIKGEDYSKTAELIYDKYDQIMPILMSFSDKVLDVDSDLNNHQAALQDNGDDFINKLSLSSYLTASSAEYFSEVFCKLYGKPITILDESKLFLNGGFNDLNYSIIEDYER